MHALVVVLPRFTRKFCLCLRLHLHHSCEQGLKSFVVLMILPQVAIKWVFKRSEKVQDTSKMRWSHSDWIWFNSSETSTLWSIFCLMDQQKVWKNSLGGLLTEREKERMMWTIDANIANSDCFSKRFTARSTYHWQRMVSGVNFLSLKQVISKTTSFEPALIWMENTKTSERICKGSYFLFTVKTLHGF